ncbi:hypothetical protein IE53DRAFT_326639 [Violaceomyces palustris]|uniref:Uncharacterized protein n=1 Tax=Violaceomyces palustris TaxID=1673888 RepID=A0ACD0P2S8_9BASI|nr:hypothetical protein IE53DRAFT_326639 [Violaceomyces palustris]
MFPYMQGAPRIMQSYPGMPQSQRPSGVTPNLGGIGSLGAGPTGHAQPSPSYLSNSRSPNSGSFPFGSGTGTGNTPGGGLPSQMAGQGQNQGQGGQLDLSDFPALGSGQQQGSGGAPGLGVGASQGSGLPSAVGNSSSSNPLLSSYASQAGTGSALSGMAALRGGGAPPGSFSQDDFPALNQGAANAQSMTGGSAAPGARGDPGSETFINGSGTAEQASAAAALQHQHQQREQHRQSLLGSVAGPRTDQQGSGSLSAARGGFGEPERNYANKLGSVAQQQSWNVASALPNAGQANGAQPSSPTSARSPLQSTRNASAASASSPSIENASARGAQGAADSLSTASSSEPASIQNSGSNPPGLVGTMPRTPAQQVLVSPADRFGLLGLLSIIKMQDPDMTMLTMGSDLQTLGLNLNAQDSLYSSFITPWSDNNMLAALQVEPDFTLPSCYNVQPPPPAQSKISSFSDETLFFIFYSTPRDALQEVAAQELYNRNWRYHKETRLWLTKEQSTEPVHKTPTYEKGTYIFFDPQLWERVSKDFILMYDKLEEKPPVQAHLQAQAQAHAQAQAQAAQAHAAAAQVQHHG